MKEASPSLRSTVPLQILGFTLVTSPPMPDGDELEGARRLVPLALSELSQYDPSSSSASAPDADLPPLLGCCFMLLPLLDLTDPDLGDICARRLRAFLRSILSRDPNPSFVPALELFVKNIVFSRFTMDDGAIQTGSSVSTTVKLCQDEPLVMPELMSHYFISLVRDEVGFEQFVSALSWSEKAMQRTPELGLLEAILLVRRSYMLSMPVVAQAHFVLLTSRCVGNGDLKLQLGVFEHAMNAYLIYLPSLGVFDQSKTIKSPLSYFSKKRHRKSCIPDTTYHSLSYQINRLLSFCKLHSDDGPHITEKDTFDIPVSFIQENQHVFPEQFKQEAVTVVNGIVSNILGCAKCKETHELDAKVSEEIIFIAAVLRLIGSSFLQILLCIGKTRVANDKQNENSIMLCVSETISLLGQYEANGLNKDHLFGVSGKPVGRERASVLMLSHFASLLLCCLRMRLGFLWKGCIILMMLAVRLVIDEEGNLGLFQFLVASKDSAISSIDQNRNLKVSVRKKSSLEVALNFNNLRKLHIRDEVGRHDFGDDKSLRSLPRCNITDGSPFLEYMEKHRLLNAVIDSDIMDFIECNTDTDYSNWFTRHRSFKEFRNRKWIISKKSHRTVSRKKMIKEYIVNKTKRLKTSST